MTDSINSADRLKASAQRFFLGVYSGNPSVVDQLAADEIVASYPIFRSIFGTPAVRGIDAYRNHAANFNANWTDTKITFHHIIADKNFVVLTWSFRGRRRETSDTESLSASGVCNWGGITLFEFNKNGKIICEIGEESEPGPAGRLTVSEPE